MYKPTIPKNGQVALPYGILYTIVISMKFRFCESKSCKVWYPNELFSSASKMISKKKQEYLDRTIKNKIDYICNVGGLNPMETTSNMKN